MNSIEELSLAAGRFLSEHNLKISVAESCTGGLLGGALTDIAGSSAYFRGGIIAYDNQIKHMVLGVPDHILDNYGAVSEQTVIAMAQGACKLFDTECAISVSGIAGPGGGTMQKPVGLVYVAVAIQKRNRSFKFTFSGNRRQIRSQTVREALNQFLLMSAH